MTKSIFKSFQLYNKYDSPLVMAAYLSDNKTVVLKSEGEVFCRIYRWAFLCCCQFF